MTRYVEVPASDIEQFLQSKGFSRTVQYQEVVYVLPHEKDPDVKLKVYTSIRTGAAAARNCGKDSIKVCVIFDNGRRSFGIGKFPRVHRTGSPDAVLARTYERMVEAYRRGSQWIREQAARRAVQGRLEEKAEFARLEREQEEAGFLSDPDFVGFAEA